MTPKESQSDHSYSRGEPRGALRERLLTACPDCGAEVFRCDNAIALDPTPIDGAEWFLLPLTTMVMAAGGAGPEGAARFDLHEHQPWEGE